jgi:small-conductance mechanosensitive channel
MAEAWHWFVTFLEEHENLWRIFVIIVFSVVIWWVLRYMLRRGVDHFVYGVKKKQNIDSTQEISTSGIIRERAIQRTRTLGAIGRNIITWLVTFIALVLVLHQVGIDLTAILASAGFIGAGLAFGAQNMVKDLLNGIFMVLEDQVGVGDYIFVEEVEGTVEDVGIRITQVRAVDGTLWFVRNGEIFTLGNSSRGFSEAIIDVTVDAGEDMKHVEDIAMESTYKVMASPDYRRKITGQPDVWGVQSMYGDRATLRFTLRTRPEAHWSVQRAIRAQIKVDFAQANIELAKQLPDIPAQ